MDETDTIGKLVTSGGPTGVVGVTGLEEVAERGGAGAASPGNAKAPTMPFFLGGSAGGLIDWADPEEDVIVGDIRLGVVEVVTLGLMGAWPFQMDSR